MLASYQAFSFMASLTKRGNRYYAQFFDAGRTPERVRFSLRTSRKDVARRTLTSLEEDFERGTFDPWMDDPWSYDEEPRQNLSIGEAADRFLTEKKRTGRSENTLRTYREILRLFQKRVDSNQKLARLSSAPLKDFVWETDLAEATMHKRYGHLRTFFRWCAAQNIIDESPLDGVTKPKKPDKFPKAISAGQLEKLCKALRRDYDRKREKNWIREGQNVWRIPLFWFAFYTGLRGEEMARLRWKHIDADNGLIYIREQKNQKEQTIPLNRKAAGVLEELDGGNPDDYVFQSPSFEGQDRNAKWFRENVSEAFRTARKLADLPEHLTFHSLRHGFCTALAEAGKSAVVIKEAARHADIQTSMRYVHMANETLKTEIEDVFE